MDLQLSPELTIPASELDWRFTRSSGPGGQHVNTSDSRVQLSWSIADSSVLSDDQRQMLLARLGQRLTAGVITVAAPNSAPNSVTARSPWPSSPIS